MRTAWYTALLIFTLGCSAAQSEVGDSKTPDNTATRHWPNGNLRTEIPMIGDKKNGIAKSYYQDGTIRQEINYVDDIKQGKSKFYYESGNLYRESDYVDNQVHGTRKLFWENGNVKAEIPFNMGVPCAGLKEYLNDGTAKTDYPRLVIREVDEILTKGMVTLVVSVSEEVKRVEFYHGRLGEGGCFDASKAIEIKPQQEGELRLYYPVPKGTFIMKEVELFVKITTAMGSPYFIEKVHPLAYENRI